MTTKIPLFDAVWKNVDFAPVLVPGASIQVNTRGGGAATIYSDQTGTTASNPITADSNGRFEVWVTPGLYDLVITATGLSYTKKVDLPASDAIAASAVQAGTAGAPTATTVWSFQPADSALGPFQLVIGSLNTDSPSLMYLGYNVADGGANAKTTEPSFRFNIEPNYANAGNPVVEPYFEWRSAVGSTGHPVQKRPFFWQFDKDTNDMLAFNIRGTTLTFDDWATGTTFASWNKTTFTLSGATGSATTLNVNSAASQGSVFNMQYNGVGRFQVECDSIETVFRHDGTSMFYLFAGGNGIVSWFTQDNSTAKFLIAGDANSRPSFAVKANASQADSLVAWLDSSGAKYSHINKAGYFMTRKSAAPADADVATGELALWFDKTAGAAKAMFKGKNASGTVVTGSVALT